MIKHVSFDVWGTLITANPEYAAARTKLIADVFHLHPDFVKSIYTRTKREIDDMAVLNGQACSTRECFTRLYQNLGVGPFTDDLALVDILHEMFLEYAPAILSATRSQLSFLESKGISMSIASNSNFIPGSVMMPFLQHEFNDVFEFGVFSDTAGYAKPSEYFFDVVAQGYFDINPMWNTSRDDILHVGDHYVCDGSGAYNSGMTYVLLDSPADIQPAFRHLASLFRQD